MFQAKQTRRDQSRSRQLSVLKNGLIDVQTIKNELPWAIVNNELNVHYQPQFNIEDHSTRHLEALVRWNHPKFGFISPAAFVPVAEELGLVEEITHFVIREVIQDISSWRNCSVPVDKVAVNISAVLLSSPDNAERLYNLLKTNVAFAPLLVLELTETATVQNTDLARQYMQKFRDLGFRIALDDFGTGSSSLAYLLDFPVDIIKIDRCFVSALPHSEKGRAITNSIVSLAKSLGLQVIAEGIEHADELRILMELGCTLIQGFYFSRPLPAAEVRDFLLCNRKRDSWPLWLA